MVLPVVQQPAAELPNRVDHHTGFGIPDGCIQHPNSPAWRKAAIRFSKQWLATQVFRIVFGHRCQAGGNLRYTSQRQKERDGGGAAQRWSGLLTFGDACVALRPQRSAQTKESTKTPFCKAPRVLSCGLPPQASFLTCWQNSSRGCCPGLRHVFPTCIAAPGPIGFPTDPNMRFSEDWSTTRPGIPPKNGREGTNLQEIGDRRKFEMFTRPPPLKLNRSAWTSRWRRNRVFFPICEGSFRSESVRISGGRKFWHLDQEKQRFTMEILS